MKKNTENKAKQKQTTKVNAKTKFRGQGSDGLHLMLQTIEAESGRRAVTAQVVITMQFSSGPDREICLEWTP